MPNSKQALLYEAQSAFREGNYAKAKKLFGKIVQKDSTHSEALFGFAKSSIYEKGVSPFEILRPIIQSNEDIPFMDISRSEVDKFYNAMKPSLKALRELTRRDTLQMLYDRYKEKGTPSKKDSSLLRFVEEYGPEFQGFPLSDRKVQFSNYALGYTFLEFAETLIKFRSNTTALISFSDDQLNLDIDDLYADALLDISVVDDLNKSLETLVRDLTRMNESVIPNATNAFNGLLGDALSGSDSDDSEASIEELTGETIESLIQKADFYRIGNGIDDDGDGCVDEEILDGKDNDGDGLIDEDLRVAPLARKSDDRKSPEYAMVTSVGESLVLADHDGNGILHNLEETTFIYPDTALRRQFDDYRFLFAKNFETNFDNEERMKWRRKIADDTDSTNIQYDLKTRQKKLGGCWNSYTEEQFKAWFRGR